MTTSRGSSLTSGCNPGHARQAKNRVHSCAYRRTTLVRTIVSQKRHFQQRTYLLARRWLYILSLNVRDLRSSLCLSVLLPGTVFRHRPSFTFPPPHATPPLQSPVRRASLRYKRLDFEPSVRPLSPLALPFPLYSPPNHLRLSLSTAQICLNLSCPSYCCASLSPRISSYLTPSARRIPFRCNITRSS